MLINRNVNIYDVNIFINMKIIITENQVDKIKSKIHEYVKKYGFEKSLEIFGDKVLFTIGFNNNPMEFLNLFNDFEVVQSEEEPDLTLFRYEKGKNLMVFSPDHYDTMYVSYDDIVSKVDLFGNPKETMNIIEDWIYDKYGSSIDDPDSMTTEKFYKYQGYHLIE